LQQSDVKSRIIGEVEWFRKGMRMKFGGIRIRFEKRNVELTVTLTLVEPRSWNYIKNLQVVDIDQIAIFEIHINLFTKLR
jgi:hypothetical protein